ncbi:noncanonical pyrimidine nucleotidase, YjjG family [Flavivirga aquatica]|uniref:Noncanonical pyrimidine nucleotidase, YjjG family n=1 Tax=Flavivirga aquatica TaxID=1849968 RepID=A0A1E5SJK8_9FLAO|nr:YjjG family noncanonical pyrimidine nucleotidase [Flavivirga aquatica]OEJ99300.1 noncanonical pyrimidine nucleotidase, YjjG family [Flavivirga aquatica]
MKLKGITDVFFDLDHTLWDFDKNSALTFEKIFKINNVNINVNDFLTHYIYINLKYWKLYREDKIEKKALRFCRLNDTFKAVGFHVDDDLIYKLSEDYIIYLTSYNHLIENTSEILDYLSSNYKLHIITNGFDEVQQGKLEKSKIDKYFKTVTNSELAGAKKPNPIIFEYALNKAGAKIESSIMIGDSYEADITGALNFGMEAIFFDINTVTLNTNIKRVTNLLDLKDYL